MKISVNTILPLLLIGILVISETIVYAAPNIAGNMKYSDEAVTLFLFLCVSIIYRYNRNKREGKYILIAILIVFIGVFGNFFSHIQNSKSGILLDILSTTKIIFCYIGFYSIVTPHSAAYIFKLLVLPARLVLLIALPLGVISQFIDFGMRGNERFGFFGFNFIFRWAHVYAGMILCSVIVICISSYDAKKNDFYIAIAAIEMMFTLKGPAIIWSVSIFIIIYYYKKHNRFKWTFVILIGIICLIFGSYQISTYLLNAHAPRAIFYKKSITTMVENFPFGSGFATFGSDAAARYYSPLYIKYGFNKLHGMNEADTSFMTDNYWPMIIGQFGLGGLFLVFFFLKNVFMDIQKSKLSKVDRAVLFSAFFYLVLHSVGSAILTTSTGVLLMSIISIALKNEKV